MSQLPLAPVYDDEARIATTWQRIADARDRRAARRRTMRVVALPLVALGAVATAIAIAVHTPPRPGALASTDPGTRIEAGAEVAAAASAASTAVAFDDGSRLVLDPGARMQVLSNDGERFSTLLERGRIAYSVHPGGPRRWEIETALATIEVVGTRFVVAQDARTVSVVVEHGVVMVRGERVAGRVQRLTAGQRLVIRSDATITAAAVPERAPPASAGPPPIDEPVPATPPVDDSAPAPATPASAALATAASAAPATAASAAPATAAGAPATAAGSPATAASGAPATPPVVAAAAKPSTTLPAVAESTTRPAVTALEPGRARSQTQPPAVAAEDRRRGETAPVQRAVPDDNPRRGGAVPAQRAVPRDNPRRGGAVAVQRVMPRDDARAVARATLAATIERADQLRPVDPQGAADLLERALANQPDDSAAGLAAFALGRLYLESLGQPGRAAEVFRRIVNRGNPRALLEDAHARLVEALLATGDRAAARDALLDYERLYPDARRAASLRDRLAVP